MCRVLACNKISGQLVSSWLTNSSFVALIHLDLSYNRLTGSLPADMLLDQLQASSRKLHMPGQLLLQDLRSDSCCDCQLAADKSWRQAA